jgi:hypothetical protein
MIPISALLSSESKGDKTLPSDESNDDDEYSNAAGYRKCSGMVGMSTVLLSGFLAFIMT